MKMTTVSTINDIYEHFTFSPAGNRKNLDELFKFWRKHEIWYTGSLTSTKRFSYSAKLILLFNGYFWGKIEFFWRKIARNWKNATIYLFVE